MFKKIILVLFLLTLGHSVNASVNLRNLVTSWSGIPEQKPIECKMLCSANNCQKNDQIFLDRCLYQCVFSTIRNCTKAVAAWRPDLSLINPLIRREYARLHNISIDDKQPAPVFRFHLNDQGLRTGNIKEDPNCSVNLREPIIPGAVIPR